MFRSKSEHSKIGLEHFWALINWVSDHSKMALEHSRALKTGFRALPSTQNEVNEQLGAFKKGASKHLL